MKRGAVESPKVARLSRLLGVRLSATVGHLELLWHFTAKQAPAGDVGRWDDDEIAEACDWEGDPGAFVDALVLARWLDPCPVHRLIVHDWHEHADDALRKAMRRRAASLAGVPYDQASAHFSRPAAAIPKESRGDWRGWLDSLEEGGGQRRTTAATVQTTADNGGHLPPSPPRPAPPGPARPGASPSRVRARDEGDGKDEDYVQDQGLDAKAVATRKAALAIADDWRPLRRKVDPADPITADDDAWSLAREEQAGHVVRLLQAGHTPDLIRPTLTWAMHDGGDGARWKGWRYQLATLADLYRHFPAIRKAMLAAQAPAAPPPEAPPRPGRGPEPPARVRQTLTPDEIAEIESRLEVITPAQAAAARAAREAKHPGGAP